MTNINDLFPSKYLKAADLKGRTIKVEIQKVEIEEVGQDKTKKPVMYLEGVERGWVLNKTNAVEIAATHGDTMESWAGKEIEIFSQMVPYQGQNVPSIRCRAVAEPEEAIPPRPKRTDFDDPLGI